MYLRRSRPVRPKRRQNRSQRARVLAQRRKRDEKRAQRRLDKAERKARQRKSHRQRAPAWDPTSSGRYAQRRALHRRVFGEALGDVVHAVAWVVHNCVAHPLLGVWPHAGTVWLHDQTADSLNLSIQPSRSPVPQVEVWWSWLLHNCVAHPLMGLFPNARWFGFHDATAERLGVPDWI